MGLERKIESVNQHWDKSPKQFCHKVKKGLLIGGREVAGALEQINPNGKATKLDNNTLPSTCHNIVVEYKAPKVVACCATNEKLVCYNANPDMKVWKWEIVSEIQTKSHPIGHIHSLRLKVNNDISLLSLFALIMFLKCFANAIK